jgi:hypothetical protein
LWLQQAIDKNLQVPLVYDDGTKLIDGILFRFVNLNNNSKERMLL